MSHTRAPMERLIRANADEINRLQQLIRETAALRWRGPEERQRHADACVEFHQRYPQLVFLVATTMPCSSWPGTSRTSWMWC